MLAVPAVCGIGANRILMKHPQPHCFPVVWIFSAFITLTSDQPLTSIGGAFAHPFLPGIHNGDPVGNEGENSCVLHQLRKPSVLDLAITEQDSPPDLVRGLRSEGSRDCYLVSVDSVSERWTYSRNEPKAVGSCMIRRSRAIISTTSPT